MFRLSGVTELLVRMSGLFGARGRADRAPRKGKLFLFSAPSAREPSWLGRRRRRYKRRLAQALG